MPIPPTSSFFLGSLNSEHCLKRNLLEHAKSNGITTDLWIGKTNLQNPKKLWLWTDGSRYHGYSNWNNNRNLLQRQIQNCGAISISDGSWYTESCGEAKPYICAVAPELIRVKHAASNDADVPTPTVESVSETTQGSLV